MIEDLTNHIKRLVYDQFGSDVSITPETALIEQGYLDSMTLLQLVMHLQDSYGITPDPTELTEDNFGSIARISEFVACSQNS